MLINAVPLYVTFYEKLKSLFFGAIVQSNEIYDCVAALASAFAGLQFPGGNEVKVKYYLKVL